MKMIVFVAFVVLAGCKKNDAPEMMATPGTSGAMGSGAEMGSAMKGSGMEMPPMPVDAAVVAGKPKPPDELAKRYVECWGFYNASKWDDFKTCYAPGAIFELPGLGSPQLDIDTQITETKRQRVDFPDDHGELELVIAADTTVIGVALITGTSSGTSGKVPSGKKVGIYLAQVVEYDGAGAKHDAAFFDATTIMSQVGISKLPARPTADKPRPKTVVIAKGSDAEKANAAVVEKLLEAIRKGDGKAVGELVADDLVWSEHALDKDLDKKSLVPRLAELRKGFHDFNLDIGTVWFAGDYVVVRGRLEGENDGDVPAMGIKKTGKRIAVPYLGVFKVDAGKVKSASLFWQRAAFTAQLGLDAPPKKSDSSDPMSNQR
jgi:steroid delta-isomerase-like uncharacterized protein